MMKHVKNKTKYLASALAITLCAPPALSAAELKSELYVTDRIVKLGDLFTDTGEKAEKVVLEAPAPGKSKIISANELERIATKHELEWEKPAYLKRVNLMRLSNTISNIELNELMHDTAIQHGANADSQIRMFGRNNGLVVPVDAGIQDIEFEQFSLSVKRDRFTAVLLVPSGGDMPKKVSLSGTVEEVRSIPVFNRSILPGEVITKQDISWIKFPAARLRSGAIMSHKQLMGMTVRRAVIADKPVNANDIMVPVVIAKGAPVTMLVRSGKMLLTAGGRALENGGMGETIRVLNAKSRLTVDAKVISPSQVEIISGPTLALAP